MNFRLCKIFCEPLYKSATYLFLDFWNVKNCWSVIGWRAVTSLNPLLQYSAFHLFLVNGKTQLYTYQTCNTECSHVRIVEKFNWLTAYSGCASAVAEFGALNWVGWVRLGAAVNPLVLNTPLVPMVWAPRGHVGHWGKPGGGHERRPGTGERVPPAFKKDHVLFVFVVSAASHRLVPLSSRLLAPRRSRPAPRLLGGPPGPAVTWQPKSGEATWPRRRGKRRCSAAGAARHREGRRGAAAPCPGRKGPRDSGFFAGRLGRGRLPRRAVGGRAPRSEGEPLPGATAAGVLCRAARSGRALGWGGRRSCRGKAALRVAQRGAALRAGELGWLVSVLRPFH